MTTEHTPKELTVYLCESAPPDSACGFNGRSLDASFDECHHTLSLKDAEKIALAYNAYASDQATIKALLEAARKLYFQYFCRIQATAHLLQATESEGDACDAIQKALAQAEKAVRP